MINNGGINMYALTSTYFSIHIFIFLLIKFIYQF